METIKAELLGSTAPAPDPIKARKKKGKSQVDIKIEKDQSSRKPSATEKSRARVHNVQHDHHERHGDRGDDDDADGGEDDGSPYRPRGRKLQTRHLCARYRVSDRTIDRWMRDPRLGFPQPVVVNRRRYWDESDIAAFDAKQKGAAVS
jgi:predicted DNA-binding transcriptional regulator AlpA